MEQTPTPRSPILTLPLEILHEILSYVLVKPVYSEVDEDDDDYDDGSDLDIDDFDFDDNEWHFHRESSPSHSRCLKFSPALTIRSVCRQFRAIAAELPFWWNDEFDLLSLKAIGESDVEDARFLSTLFKDQRVVRSVSKRKHWHIHDVPSLIEIMETILSFSEKTVSITVSELERPTPRLYDPQWLDIVIGHLAPCPNIRAVELGPICGRTTLTRPIAELWPAIERLIVWLPFWGVGLVDGLTQLSKMEVRTSRRSTIPSSFSLLPVESTSTLTHLDIGFWPPGRNYVATSLDGFVNLITLRINPLSDDICQFLLRYSGHLRTFSTSSFRSSAVSLGEIGRTFSRAQCLQTVKKFTFKFHMETGDGSIYLIDDDNVLARFNPIVEAISKLSSIQILHLGMPLDGRWYRHFHRLTNLKELKWLSNEDEVLYLSRKALGLSGDAIEYRPFEDHRPKKAAAIFSEAFTGLPERPKLFFRFWAHWRREEWYEEPQEDDPIDLMMDHEWGPRRFYEQDEFFDDDFVGWGDDEWWNGEPGEDEEGDEEEDEEDEDEVFYI